VAGHVHHVFQQGIHVVHKNVVDRTPLMRGA
jgi:hypothetical protein